MSQSKGRLEDEMGKLGLFMLKEFPLAVEKLHGKTAVDVAIHVMGTLKGIIVESLQAQAAVEEASERRRDAEEGRSAGREVPVQGDTVREDVCDGESECEEATDGSVLHAGEERDMREGVSGGAGQDDNPRAEERSGD